MILVEKHIIKSGENFKQLKNITFLSKNLYNSGLYTIRQHYFLWVSIKLIAINMNTLKDQLKNIPVKKDKCIICGKESPYIIDTHIDFRIGYIEGAGQGCFKPKWCSIIL